MKPFSKACLIKRLNWIKLDKILKKIFLKKHALNSKHVLKKHDPKKNMVLKTWSKNIVLKTQTLKTWSSKDKFLKKQAPKKAICEQFGNDFQSCLYKFFFFWKS